MKKFNSISDLAINGAPPAFEETLHVGRPNIADRALFDQYVDQIYEAKWLTNNGPLVQELEHQIQDYLSVKHCVAMCNGTIALEIATRALNFKREVIVPSFTFIATAHALQWQGIKPVFADIDAKTHNLDPKSVENLITSDTTGIIGVHLWGRPAPIGELQKIADKHDLKLMFDSAHAFGCTYEGVSIGNFGECEVLSFHATKFFNTFEGGAVVTNNDRLAEQMRLMRNFGFDGLDRVIYSGTNGKMTEICAAMGLCNLQVLDEVLDGNRQNYEEYLAQLDAIVGIKILRNDVRESSNYQYIVLEVDENFPVKRDQLIEILHVENIRARRYFWPGCHEMKPYRGQTDEANIVLENTLQTAEKVLVLPTGASVSFEDIKSISSLLRLLSETTQ
ncbi:MAG: dTDP-4-dehydro-6-deoxyglucose aminotransferase [Tenericutes bacterium]|nr:MAG: dTDP-4-dehydro-6-deoxyglucose aminotransferase [Mycoplasmatota bacterium]